MFRDDPIIFSDLSLIKTGFDAVQSYNLKITFRMWVVLICAAVGAVLLYLIFRKRKGAVKTRILVIVLVAASIVPLGRAVYLDSSVYQRSAVNAYADRSWVPTEYFMGKGFVYPFLYSITDIIRTPPENYSLEETEALLAQYTKADIPENK